MVKRFVGILMTFYMRQCCRIGWEAMQNAGGHIDDIKIGAKSAAKAAVRKVDEIVDILNKAFVVTMKVDDDRRGSGRKR